MILTAVREENSIVALWRHVSSVFSVSIDAGNDLSPD